MRHGSVFLAGLLLAVLACPSPIPVLAGDQRTNEAIKQAEEGVRDARRALQAPPGQPAPYPWWGWPPYTYPPAPVAPYPGVPLAPYPQIPQSSASPYPIQVNPAGRVLILVDPVDAEVYVDGVRLQQRADLAYEIGLLAGPHRVDVRKDGYKPYAQRMEIVPGSGLYLPIALEK